MPSTLSFSPRCRRLVGLARLAPLLFAAACGGSGNSLTGSVGQVRDLSFDQVHVSASQDSVVIQYIRQPGNQITARLTVATAADPNIALGRPAYVAGTDAFVQAVQLTRVSTPNPDGTPSTDIFPKITSGSVTFDQVSLAPGGMVSGTFGVLLGSLTDATTHATTVPAGYTLNGTFHQAVSSP